MMQPKTGQPCGCRRGEQRDNCPTCEGTGIVIDFKAIRAATAARVVAECWTRKHRERMMDMGNDSFAAGDLVPLALSQIEVGYHRAAGHDVREVTR